MRPRREEIVRRTKESQEGWSSWRTLVNMWSEGYVDKSGGDECLRQKTEQTGQMYNVSPDPTNVRGTTRASS